MKETKSRLSNNDWKLSQGAGVFRRACSHAGVAPTKRQASKWRRGIGKARLFAKEAGRKSA